MRGTYHMVAVETGGEGFDVGIPGFSLDSPAPSPRRGALNGGRALALADRPGQRRFRPAELASP